MSITVLPQLQAIEAELASQEEQLAAQLASVQEQLNGLQAVMPMFAGASVGTEEDSIVSAPEEELATTPEEPPVEEAAESAEAVAEAEVPEKKAAKKKATAKKATAKKTTAKKKKDGRTASWQKYTRPGVKNESIPDAVRLILETQPQKDFKIAEVMDALFTEDMPKTQYLKARNRISNVLSGGVRAGDWHKGARGTYRMTAA